MNKTYDELAARLSKLEHEHQELVSVTIELVGATLDLSQAARMQSHEPMHSRGERAFEAIGRAVDRLREIDNE